MMDDETRALKDRIGAKSNEELLSMIGPDAADYRKQALDFAKSELARRGVPVPFSPGSLYGQDNTQEEDQNVCPNCRGQLRSGLLFADRELTIIFTDNNEERFVEVWACTECGQVQLVADFDTDVDEGGYTPRL